MLPSPPRPFAAGETITLTDSSGTVRAIAKANTGGATGAGANYSVGPVTTRARSVGLGPDTYTAAATGWSGGGGLLCRRPLATAMGIERGENTMPAPHWFRSTARVVTVDPLKFGP